MRLDVVGVDACVDVSWLSIPDQDAQACLGLVLNVRVDRQRYSLIDRPATVRSVFRRTAL